VDEVDEVAGEHGGLVEVDVIVYLDYANNQ
jgi:hypothetical protein